MDINQAVEIQLNGARVAMKECGYKSLPVVKRVVEMHVAISNERTMGLLEENTAPESHMLRFMPPSVIQTAANAPSRTLDASKM